MLRSIFSLIHRILDTSEKKYNNTKSKAVIYCFTNPDDTVKSMNLEVNGKQQKIIGSVEHQETKRIDRQKERTFSIETEQGDVVTCKHKQDVNIVAKSDERRSSRVTFLNTEEKCPEEIIGDVEVKVQPSVRDLMVNFPKKRIEISSGGKDTISLLLEQIQIMKTGLERLQELAAQFNYSERFNEDINYLINNIGPHLEREARKRKTEKNDISPKV